MSDDVLPQFADDDFSRVLVVVAHPDDAEYGTSAAVATWTAAGKEVAYLLLTRGEAGIDTMTPEEAAKVRGQEQVTGCEAVGVTQVEFLDHPDGMLEYGLPVRRDIARSIRAFKPDAVVIGSWEIEFMGGFNHADHRVAGLAALDAIRDAGNRWVFTELVQEDLLPHSVRWLLIAGDPKATHAVDVTGAPLEAGIVSLESHREYLAALPWHPAPRMMLPAITAFAGRAAGVPNAITFRAVDFQAPPPGAAEMFGDVEPGVASPPDDADVAE